MIIDLRSYNDLGKCAYGSLMETFDTEKNAIHVYKGKGSLDNTDEEKIEQIDDLKPYLWNIPFVAFHDNVQGKSVSVFTSKGTWFERYYQEIIDRYNDNLSKIEKKLKKPKNEKLKAKYENEKKECLEGIKCYTKSMEDMNDRLEENWKKILKDNQQKFPDAYVVE